MLYTTDILRALGVIFKGTRVYYDVIPCDYFVTADWNRYPIALVVNDSPSRSNGRHWLAFWAFSEKSPVHFFCSYGLGIDNYTPIFRETLENHGKTVIENTKTLQSIGSTVCGDYCIYALHKFYRGCCLMSLYSNFSADTAANDRKVKRYVGQYLSNRNKYMKMMLRYRNQCCIPFQ